MKSNRNRTQAALVCTLVLFTVMLKSSFAALTINDHAISGTDTIYVGNNRDFKSNDIPDSVFQMTHLRHLSITGMDCDYGDHTTCWAVSEIPTKIENLRELRSLSIQVHGIRRIPGELIALKHLKILNLSDGAGTIENLEKLIGLEELYLYGCGLTALPERIGDLKQLKKLGLAGNYFNSAEQKRIKKLLPHCEVLF